MMRIQIRQQILKFRSQPAGPHCVAPFVSPFQATLLAVVLVPLLFGQVVQAQQGKQLVEPIFRVAHEEPVQQAPQLAARVARALPQPPFDLTQRPGEHPLMPALRLAEESLQKFDQNIVDYSAMMIKQERINGVLGPQETAYVKVRNQPFGVYMFFLKPNKGQECLYTDGPGGVKGTLYARGSGMLKRLGVMELDPDGRLAMKGQKYPITKIGLRKLMTELIDVARNDVQFGECNVRNAQCQINKRPCTLIEVVHPTERNSFRFHKAELFIDNELQIPIRYAAYLWPEKPGEPPPLEEAYTYLNLEMNKNFTDLNFDRENPEYFK
ncbi:MAG: DUF1571 domain-containing protein [Pirellulales bacterium]|nr:DUF1571 domain-containing protein [Pirellulales bacterium]